MHSHKMLLVIASQPAATRFVGRKLKTKQANDSGWMRQTQGTPGDQDWDLLGRWIAPKFVWVGGGGGPRKGKLISGSPTRAAKGNIPHSNYRVVK